ncbi:MAG: preprotein translocase subunit YajC [Clostridiales bacterium]|nr:preprotein translocase subunit YajC [Clostridiales bacterium]
MNLILLEEEATTSTGMSGFAMIIWLIVIFVILYLIMIRPQRKEQKKKEAMLSEVAVGDTVLTIAGFYGTVIDIVDDTVIVEFGNNRNCRIPMQKSAISQVEKPEEATAAVEKKEEKKEEKKDDKKDANKEKSISVGQKKK